MGKRKAGNGLIRLRKDGRWTHCQAPMFIAPNHTCLVPAQTSLNNQLIPSDR